MAIISALPNTLTNGTTADATQVMADLNQIFNNVNANAAENGANSSITSLSGLLTPLSVSQGGTGSSTASGAFTNIVAPGGNMAGHLNAARATVASAATTADIWGAAGNQIDWTGTVTCTGFPAAAQAGSYRRLICAAAASFTAGANMLINGYASGATATLSAGDIVEVEAITTTQFKLTITKYDGTAVVSPSNIQPLPTPTLNANALTMPSATYTLDFRNATLGAGGVTTISGSPSALTIPSGATLGGVNAVAQELVWIVLSNAGTLEYAVVNIAGGVGLSETGVISTTAISAAATSASVIYSNSARTNVPYRVIGMTVSTQATAGQWATAPSLVQGAGGQALTSMSSLGFGQTRQDLTGSRALATTYYNTTGKPIRILVAFTNNTANVYPTATINGVSYISGANQATVGGFLYVNEIIMPGESYSVTGNSGVSTLNAWYEVR